MYFIYSIWKECTITENIFIKKQQKDKIKSIKSIKSIILWMVWWIVLRLLLRLFLRLFSRRRFICYWLIYAITKRAINLFILY
jgi:hypothetical protein